ncbi:MAG: hypothetical protein R3C60_08600 [Parvularculaceae bacterium]
MNEIAFAPSLSSGVIIAVSTIVLIVAMLSIFRAPRSGAFRLLAAISLIALLLNPQIRIAERTPLSDIVAILVDNSASNKLDERGSITEQAAKALEAKLNSIDDINVIRGSVGTNSESRLGAAISNIISENPRARLGAVFVVSDGEATDKIAVNSLDATAPIHLLMTGRADEIDRKITLIKAPRYGIVKEGVDVAFRIDDVGPDQQLLKNRGQAIVTLSVNGDEVLSQPVPVGAEVSFKAPLPRPGKTIVELKVESVESELTEKNNIAVLPITVIRDRLRVLLISGEPHPGERVWRNLLKSDPAIDLVHFTILRPIEKAQSDSALEKELALIEFPQDELFIQKLYEFDLVIFDRYTYRGVLNAYHFDNLARYVEGGGAVLISSGPEFEGYLSLAAQRNFAYVLPALPAGDEIDGPFRPKVSKEGERHPVTENLPEQDYWGRWVRLMPASKRAGMTLMTGPQDEPLLILNRVGEGRVGMIQSDDVWLWARGFDGGGPHAELLRRVAHWLMKEPDLEEERLSLTERQNALNIERRSVSDKAAPVEITMPDGETRDVALKEIKPGFFTAEIANAPEGLYRGRSGDLFAIGAVGLAAPPEFENVVSDRTRLESLIQESGGGVFDVRKDATVSIPDIRRVAGNTAKRAGSGWAGIVARNAYRTEAVRDAPVAPAWAWLGLIGGFLVAAWLVEGRGGRLFRKT